MRRSQPFVAHHSATSTLIVTRLAGLGGRQDAVQVCVLDAGGTMLANRRVQNDQINAQIVFRFAQAMQLRSTLAISSIRPELRGMAARVRQVAMLPVQQQNRLAASIAKALQKMIRQAFASTRNSFRSCKVDSRN